MKKSETRFVFGVISLALALCALGAGFLFVAAVFRGNNYEAFYFVKVGAIAVGGSLVAKWLASMGWGGL